MNIPSEILSFWLLVDEPIGTAIGVLVVLCLIRQNLWAWPLGVIYILASVSVLLEGRLFANLLLHLVAFLPMNLYGWYYWIYGKQNDQNRLVVSWSDWKSLWVLILICLIIGTVLGSYFSSNTDAAHPYLDSSVFVLSVGAIWLTARKKIDNWFVWFVVNVISIYLYFSQGLIFYGWLYIVYLGMAVGGFIEWRKAMYQAIVIDTRKES